MVSPHDELIAAFAEWSPELSRGVSRDTPLLTTGRLDSMAVFLLLLWMTT